MKNLFQKGKVKTLLSNRKIRRNLFLISLVALPLARYLVFWLYVNVQTLVLSFQTFDYFTGEYVFVGFDNYVRIAKNIMQSETMQNAFLNTFRALLINFTKLPLAIFVAYAFYKKVPGEKFFRVAFYLPSMISIVVLTLAFKYMFTNNESVFIGPVAQLLNNLGVQFSGWDTIEHPETVWLLIYSYCVWSGLGTNVIMINGAMNRIPRAITESAKVDGIGFWRELFSINLPLIMPTISTFALSSIMSVFAFYLAPMLLAETHGVNGSVFTLPWYIFETVQSGDPLDLITSTTVGLMFTVIMLPIIVSARRILNKLTPDVSF